MGQRKVKFIARCLNLIASENRWGIKFIERKLSLLKFWVYVENVNFAFIKLYRISPPVPSGIVVSRAASASVIINYTEGEIVTNSIRNV